MNSNIRFSSSTKLLCAILPAVLALAIVIPCQANVPTPPTPPAVPAGYCQTIDSELHNDLSAFNTTLDSLWNGTTFPTLYAGNLLSANGNSGPSLISSSHFQQVQTQMQELQAMGYQGIMVAVTFPVLYAPFYSDQSVYQQYVSFYAQVAATARAMGMKIVVENDVVLTSDAQAGWTNASAFYQTLNWQQYVAARAQMAATVAQVMQPDYLVLAEEPDSEAIQSGQTSLNNPINAAAMVSAELSSVQALNLPIKLGAGVGSWVVKLNQYMSNYVALPLDYIDFHIYPVNTVNGKSMIGNALTIASMAAAAGKPVAMSETWLWKMEDSEWNVLTSDQYRAREPFPFWAAENNYFLQTLQKLANYTQMIYQAPSEPGTFFAYQDYGGTDDNGGAATCTCTTATCSVPQILSNEIFLSGNANMQSTYTTTGINNFNMLVTTADTVPPSNPGNLTGNAAGTTVSLSWTASTDDIGVAGYNVIRDGVWIANTSQTSYIDLGLSTSTTYGYQIQAFDLAGNTSVMTPTLSLSTVYTLPPSAPTNVTAGPFSTQGMTITWTAAQDPMGISTYQIYRGTSSTGLAQVGTVRGTMTTYVDTGLTAGTTYYYGVIATQAQYVSDMSSIASGTTLAAPSAPTSLQGTANSTKQIVLSWTPGPSGLAISFYQIFRGSTPSSLVQVGTRTTPSYTDTALTPGTTYYYAVQETDVNGNVSPMSATVAVTTLAPPSAPSGVTATANSKKQVSVTWTPGPSGVTIAFYQIFRGNTPSSLVQVGSRTTPSYVDTGLTAGTTYYYAVQETDVNGNVSPMSDPVSVTTLQ